MKISGHKTPSVFRRYDITDEADLAEAAERLNAKRTRTSAPTEFGHSSGIVSTKRGPPRWGGYVTLKLRTVQLRPRQTSTSLITPSTYLNMPGWRNWQTHGT
jgi:hypothetical protein